MSRAKPLITQEHSTDMCSRPLMFSLQSHLTSLPRNAEVHIRLRWHRGLLGFPVLAPAVVVANRHSRR